MRRSIFYLFVCLAVALFTVGPVQAHPADMYVHTHSVSLSPDGMQIVWELLPGPTLAQFIWYNADQNRDEAVSHDEARTWAQTRVQNFGADIDGSPVNLSLEAVDWPSGIPELLIGDAPIRMHLRANWIFEADRVYQLTLQK